MEWFGPMAAFGALLGIPFLLCVAVAFPLGYVVKQVLRALHREDLQEKSEIVICNAMVLVYPAVVLLFGSLVLGEGITPELLAAAFVFALLWWIYTKIALTMKQIASLCFIAMGIFVMISPMFQGRLNWETLTFGLVISAIGAFGFWNSP